MPILKPLNFTCHFHIVSEQIFTFYELRSTNRNRDTQHILTFLSGQFVTDTEKHEASLSGSRATGCWNFNQRILESQQIISVKPVDHAF
jgi:hypothetical protein